MAENAKTQSPRIMPSQRHSTSAEEIYRTACKRVQVNLSPKSYDPRPKNRNKKQKKTKKKTKTKKKIDQHLWTNPTRNELAKDRTKISLPHSKVLITFAVQVRAVEH